MRHCRLLVLAVLLPGCAAVSNDTTALVPVEPASTAADAPESVATRTASLPPDEETGTYGIDATDPDIPLEVMTVIEERIQSWQDRRRVYRNVQEGKRLFALNQYDEAFPYLIDTAERGFKDSQARVGQIYLQGLGEKEPDPRQGVGWLGVASEGRTSPGIRNYFNDVWRRIPETHVAYFEEVVEEYRSRYGEGATGVVCDLNRPLRSFVKELTCHFEAPLPEEIRVMLSDFQGSEEAREFIEERLGAAREAIEAAEACRDPVSGGTALGC